MLTFEDRVKKLLGDLLYENLRLVHAVDDLKTAVRLLGERKAGEVPDVDSPSD